MSMRNFFICGLTGWCMEILFTAAHSLQKRDGRLIGQTSLWMFPIYGTAVFIKPIYSKIKKIPAIFRGMLYGIGIFFVEYTSGSFLKRHQLCPWDYSKAKSNINGVIRLDFAPLWIAAGLLFERVLLAAQAKNN